MVYNGHLYITGADGNQMYIAKLDPTTGNFVSSSSVSIIDIDSDPASTEVGKTIGVDVTNQIVVMGNRKVTTFNPFFHWDFFSIAKCKRTKLRCSRLGKK